MPTAEDGSTVGANFYSGQPSRALATAVRRFADANSTAIKEAKATGRFVATVAVVTAGAASDGNALVSVTWRGALVTVEGYAASYTPIAGHRVVCDLIKNQLFIAYRIIGQP